MSCNNNIFKFSLLSIDSYGRKSGTNPWQTYVWQYDLKEQIKKLINSDS